MCVLDDKGKENVDKFLDECENVFDVRVLRDSDYKGVEAVNSIIDEAFMMLSCNHTQAVVEMAYMLTTNRFKELCESIEYHWHIDLTEFVLDQLKWRTKQIER